MQQRHRFRRSGGLIQQRGVRDLHPRQIRDQRLEIQERFETTLRDALSMLLASAVQTAVVVDEGGRYAGVLTLDTLGIAFRSAPEEHLEAAGVT